MTVGTKVILFGRQIATVIGVHKGGKTLHVTTEHGKTTFVKAANAKVVTA